MKVFNFLPHLEQFQCQIYRNVLRESRRLYMAVANMQVLEGLLLLIQSNVNPNLDLTQVTSVALLATSTSVDNVAGNQVNRYVDGPS